MTLTSNARRMAVALAVILAAWVFLVGSNVSPARGQTAVDPAAPMAVTSAATANDHELLVTWKYTQNACKAQNFWIDFQEEGNNANAWTVYSEHTALTAIDPKQTTVEESYSFTMTHLTGGVEWRVTVNSGARQSGDANCTSAWQQSGKPDSNATPKGTGTPEGRNQYVKGPNHPSITLYPGDTEMRVVWDVYDDPNDTSDDISGWKLSWYYCDGDCTRMDEGKEPVLGLSAPGKREHTITGMTNGKAYRVTIEASTTLSSGTVSRPNAWWSRDRYDPDDDERAIDHRVPNSGGPEFAANAAIANFTYTQGTAITDVQLPTVTTAGVTYELNFVTPAGLSVTNDHKLTGNPTLPQIRTKHTWAVRDANGLADAIIFAITIAPQKPANFAAAGAATQANLTWDALDGVTKWQLKQGTADWADITGSDDATDSHDVTGLTDGTEYTFKLRAVVGTGTAAVNGVESDAVSTTPEADKTDYDADGDGLIEVANLAQLNAIRWDLNGDGAVASGDDTTNYTAAFPTPATGMGCPTSGTPTGCIGYELTADLDFDTDDTDGLGSGDKYWNDGDGFKAIGTYTGTLDGNGHVIENLLVKRTRTTRT